MGTWTVTRQGRVAVVAMDDGKANALALEELDSLSQALKEMRGSDAGALVLTGRTGFLSAGLNLKLLPALELPQLLKVLERFAQVVGDELFMMPLPCVAAVSGHAIAAGAMLALACDVRLLARGAFKFGLNEVPGGLPLPSFGAELMRQAVSPQHLVKLTMHGVMLNPDEALAHGLCDAVLEPHQVLPQAVARAQALAELPPTAYVATKQVVRGPIVERNRALLRPEMEELGRALGGRG
jgi:enoyl-CoA hydratase